MIRKFSGLFFKTCCYEWFIKYNQQQYPNKHLYQTSLKSRSLCLRIYGNIDINIYWVVSNSVRNFLKPRAKECVNISTPNTETHTTMYLALCTVRRDEVAVALKQKLCVNDTIFNPRVPYVVHKYMHTPSPMI